MVKANQQLQQTADDSWIDTVISAAMMAVFMMVLLPMLPVVRSAQSYYESQRYEGQTDTKTLSSVFEIQHIVLSTPWIGAYFINDGPNEVEIRINGSDCPPFVMYPGETVTINRAGARDRIYAIYYKCFRGKTSVVRIIGEY